MSEVGGITKQGGEPSGERVESTAPKPESLPPLPLPPTVVSSCLTLFEKLSVGLSSATLLVLGLTLFNLVNSERPWVGMELAIQGWDVDQTPQAIVVFRNGGRRPAKVTRVRFDHNDFVTFPSDPPYRRNSTDVASIALILPNLTVTNSQPLEKLTRDRISFLATRQKILFVYASIEYEDVLTHLSHWTHGCWQYLHGFQNAGSGFVNCGTYNEVD